jgi:hypothetical protein
MGVDWLGCDYCGETFPDCGDFVECGCGNKWCDRVCAEGDGYEHNKLTTEDANEYEYEKSCVYCRGEKFEDSELLEYCLELLGFSKEELIKRYKNSYGMKEDK